MPETCRGHCFCQAISFEITLPTKWCVTCHCESCRRQCSAPMTTYLGTAQGQWKWTGKRPKTYCSSPGVERTFCDHCGSPISFRSEKMSGHMFFYVAAMEEPDKFIPDRHVAFEEKLDWLEICDTLPKQTGPQVVPPA